MPTLFDYCLDGDVEGVEKCLDQSPISVNDYNKSGATPLGVAVEKQDVNLIKRLLKFEADPNARNTSAAGTYQGYTPMHIAAKCCSDAIVFDLLFENGGSPKLQGKDGWAPLHCACFANNIPAIQWLLEKKVDPNVVNEHKISPILSVINHCRPEAVRLLIKYGAKLDVKDINGDTIFHHALHCQMHKLFEDSYTIPEIQIDASVMIAMYGCNPEVPNRDGLLATHYVKKDFGGETFTTVLKLIYMNGKKLLENEKKITEATWNYMTLLAVKNWHIYRDMGIDPQQAKDLVDNVHKFENERKKLKESRETKKRAYSPKKRKTPIKEESSSEEESDNSDDEVVNVPTPPPQQSPESKKNKPIDNNNKTVVSSDQQPVVTQPQIVYTQSSPTVIQQPTVVESKNTEIIREKIIEVKWQHPSDLPPPRLDLAWAYHNRVSILCCVIFYLAGVVTASKAC